MSATSSGLQDRAKIALVGAGVIGTHHGLVISQLADRAELVAVVDIHPERAAGRRTRRQGLHFPH